MKLGCQKDFFFLFINGVLVVEEFMSTLPEEMAPTCSVYDGNSYFPLSFSALIFRPFQETKQEMEILRMKWQFSICYK